MSEEPTKNEPFRISAEAKMMVRWLVFICLISFVAMAWLLMLGVVEMDGRFWWSVSIVGAILLVSGIVALSAEEEEA